jgi:hypothetical protein
VATRSTNAGGCTAAAAADGGNEVCCVFSLLMAPRTRSPTSHLYVRLARSHATGRAQPSRAAARDTVGYARRSTPPPFRSSPNGREGRGASPPRGTKNEWFQPLKPISTFKGVLLTIVSVACATAGLLYPCSNVRARCEHAERPDTRLRSCDDSATPSPSRLAGQSPAPVLGRRANTMAKGSPTQPGRRSNSPGSPISLKLTAPPPRSGDSSDEEADVGVESSSDDGTGTAEQQDAKKARRERRRKHREFIRQLRAEKREIHKRVQQAVFRCDDVLNDDLTALKEVAHEVRDSVSTILEQYVQQNGRGLNDLIDIKSWFSRVETMDKTGGQASKPAVDLQDFEEGWNEINDIVTKMSSGRDTIEHKAHLLVDVAAEMVRLSQSHVTQVVI